MGDKRTSIDRTHQIENFDLTAMKSIIIAVFFAIVLTAVEATNAAGKEYLAKKATEECVVTLPSGLLYKVVKTSDSKKSPTANSPCDCHYKGTLIDGTEFDSSYKRGKPTTFAPNQVIKGWTEAMQLMTEGEKWELFISSDLAYGDRDRGKHITPGAV